MGLNFLGILQLLAIGLYWECPRIYPRGLSLRKGSVYTWFLMWENRGLFVEVNGFVQTSASPCSRVEFSKASPFHSILLLSVSA